MSEFCSARSPPAATSILAKPHIGGTMPFAKTPSPSPDRDVLTRQFDAQEIWHPNLKASADRVLALLRRSRRPQIILIVGPAGVGKTYLLEHIRNVLNYEARAAIAADPSLIAAILVEADAPMGERFTWPPLLRQVLIELGEPSVDRKIIGRGRGRPELLLGPGDKPNEIGAAVVTASNRHHLTTLEIDEAHHIAWDAPPRQFVQHLERLKSLSNRAHISIVVAGSYKLLRFSELSGQLLRRRSVVHLARYRSDRKEEVEAFKCALEDLTHALPLPLATNLGVRWQDAYERSIGSIGLLHSWLANALGAALDEGSPKITKVHLRGAALPASDLLQLLTEAQQGEGFEEEDAPVRRRLRTSLGLFVPSQNSNPGLGEAATEPPASTPPPATPAPGPKRRPGERAPGRDPVGNPESEVAA
jgi:AAA domain